MRNIILLFCLLFVKLGLQAQMANKTAKDSLRLEKIESILDSVAKVDKSWNTNIEISVGTMPLPEFVRNVAKNSGVNIGVKGADRLMITCNFSNPKITNLLYYLCKEYNLDIDLVGNIISIYPVTTVFEPKIPKIHYSESSKTLGYDLDNDELYYVSKKISDVSGINLIVPQSLLSRKLSGFVGEMPVSQAISALATTNGLRVKKENSNVWKIMATDSLSSGVPYISIDPMEDSMLSVDSVGLITARISMGDVQSIILDLCNRKGLNHFFTSPISHRTSIYVKDVEFEVLLGLLLSGTPYSFYCENDIYIFGAKKDGVEGYGLSSVKMIPMRNRSVDKIQDVIPIQLKKDLQIKQFNDLNSVVICGDQRYIGRIETFLKSIDIRVPLITIEVMIAEVTKKTIQELGISAGIGKAPDSPQTYTPLDMTLKASTINNLIGRFGPTNLGKVNDDFYLTIKALEEKGGIEIKSTPKLSTLNGHEASLKSGETQYYKEVMNNIIGTQNPIQSESYTWKSVDANMALRIVPFVSADSTITLNIEIEQSEFTAREEKTAPPGIVTRSFKSQIRVQNGEMVLLGGIDRSSRDKTSTGLPLVARIPILRWLFGNTRNNKSDYKLTLFIKPTVIM